MTSLPYPDRKLTFCLYDVLHARYYDPPLQEDNFLSFQAHEMGTSSLPLKWHMRRGCWQEDVFLSSKAQEVVLFFQCSVSL